MPGYRDRWIAPAPRYVVNRDTARPGGKADTTSKWMGRAKRVPQQLWFNTEFDFWDIVDELDDMRKEHEKAQQSIKEWQQRADKHLSARARKWAATRNDPRRYERGEIAALRALIAEETHD